MNISEMMFKIKRDISTIIGLKLNNVIGFAKGENGFTVSVEMVEKESIPNAMDLLGLYEINLDVEGAIIGFERVALRKRGDTEISRVEIPRSYSSP